MASVRFNLDQALFSKHFDQVRAKLGDLSELTTLLASRAIRMIDRKFQRSGPGWEPLAERTLVRRRKGGKGAKPLLDTGKLRASITANADIFEVTGDGFRIGSNLIYANTHQYGNTDGFRRGIPIPARPFLPTEDEMAAEFVPLIERYLTDVLQ